MARLSSPIEQIKDHYWVVVVGSGYGAAIAASRLARAGQQVCVLERGKEFQPGEYPDTELRAVEEMQAATPDGHVGSKTGLYDFNFNEDINVFKGCGLGGTSLVNANVALRAEPRVFDDARWPKALKADLGTLMEEGYDRAEEMLKPSPYPDSGYPALPKLEALALSAKSMGAKFYHPPINVNFTVSGPNHVGVDQRPCNCCGDCVTGCNYAAKNTLIMNYLPDAKNRGAEIYTQVDVRWVEPDGVRWRVHYEPLGVGREKFHAPEMTLTAEVLILAGGTLGSTEILLRSAAHGLKISGRAGERFTGNGDVLGFAYDTDHTINGVGWGHHRPGEIPPVGPCITGVIDMRGQPELNDGMVIEEGSPPGPIAGFLPAGLSVASDLVGRKFIPWSPEAIREDYQKLASWVEGPYHGAVHKTETYLVMTHDDGAGRMALENDQLRIHWPGVGDQPIFDKVNATLEKAAKALGGEYLIDPLWSKLMRNNLMSVHPLGGCVMAEDAEHGVVNHKGQVFSSTQGAAVYNSLYVMDGSVVPVPLGVNPLLTISALTERAVALAARERGWTIDYKLPSQPPQIPNAPKVGIEFTETMSGYFSGEVKDDYQRGADAGKASNSPLTFTLTIVSEDLETMLADPGHTARMVGSVVAPVLSPHPLMVNSGSFSLFAVDPSQPGARRMWYRMALNADSGRVYYFEGFKLIHDEPAYDAWHDTTTLYVTVWDGPSNASPVLGKGILIIRPQDFLDQLTTMRATNAATLEQRLDAEGRFARFFMGVLAQKYGRIFRPPVKA
ncbi:MAG: GMC family oxidoreductase N-terminal domain-containing protein [Terriglobia bacterium]